MSEAGHVCLTALLDLLSIPDAPSFPGSCLSWDRGDAMEGIQRETDAQGMSFCSGSSCVQHQLILLPVPF